MDQIQDDPDALQREIEHASRLAYATRRPISASSNLLKS
jgi:hypothetical protein